MQFLDFEQDGTSVMPFVFNIPVMEMPGDDDDVEDEEGDWSDIDDEDFEDMAEDNNDLHEIQEDNNILDPDDDDHLPDDDF
jgi:hypothetical protein